jgi:hypothetical protein
MPKQVTYYIEGLMNYAHITEGNPDQYGNYSICLVLEGDNVRQAREMSLKVNQNPEKYDGMAFVNLRSQFPPNLYDKEGGEYKGPTMLENGCKVVAKVAQKPYTYNGRSGISSRLSGLKLIDPVEYKMDDGDKKAKFDEAASDEAPW